MERRDILIGLMAALAAVAFLLALAAPGDAVPDRAPPQNRYPDPIVESFERALNREPGPATPAAGESIDDDELYQRLNAVHWTRKSTADNEQARQSGEDRVCSENVHDGVCP